MKRIDKETMIKILDEFLAVHVDGERDFIGPNATDAPFFNSLRASMKAGSTDESKYEKASELLFKYRNTQIPWLSKKVGLEITDMQEFLDDMREQGIRAKARKRWLEVIYGDLCTAGKNGTDEPTTDWSALGKEWTSMGGHYDIYSDEFDKLMNAYSDGKRIREEGIKARTVQASLYEDVWYGRNDSARRWPKKSTRVKLVFLRNNKLKDKLKFVLGFPALKWNGEFWSLNANADDVKKAIEVFHEYDYHTHELSSLVLPKAEKKISKVSASVEGDSLVLQWPWIQDDSLRTKVMSIVKGVMGRKWDAKRKAWLVPLSQGAFLQGRLDGVYQPLCDAINTLPELTTIIENTAERIAISGASELNDEELINKMRIDLSKHFPEGRELYPFQYVGVRFIELANGRALIGDDMGIGKTIQALAYIALTAEHHPALVVCPANVKFNWLKEAKAWLPNYTSAVVENGKSDIPDTDIVIINYDLMKKQQIALENRGFNIVVFDESHYLKNVKAQRTQASLSVAQASKSIVCLSGTAITNRPVEFYTTLNLLRPNEFSNFFSYAKRYCDGHQNDWGHWDFSGSSNEEELHERTRTVGIRRLKKEVMAELPDKIRQIIDVEPTKAERKEYNDLHRSWINRYQMYQQNNNMPAGFVLNMLTDLRHHCGRMKVTATANWVREYHDLTGKPIVVFAHHKDVIEMLGEALSDEKIGFITGSVSAQKRQQMVDRFQDGNINVLICSTVAAKEGLTLTEADTVVFVEREWVPGWEEQAEDRVNRIGQDSSTVWANYLSVTGTIDDKFNTVIEAKREVVQAILDGGSIEERAGIASALLQAMVDAGELPKEMLKDMGVKG